jgi:zinc transport system ATP-binding protein
MDEPTAGVDAGSQAALAATLHELARDGRTVVLVAHELGPMEPLVTRTVELGHGRVVRETAAHETPGSPA